MAPEVICAACGIARERQFLVTTMRSSQWIRSSGSSDRIETYHDRIREVVAVADRIRRRSSIHALVARALVGRGSDDCEVLFEHYRGRRRCRNTRPVRPVLPARRRPRRWHSIGRLSSTRRPCLSRLSRPRSTLAGRAATALANAGRPAEAADAYLRGRDGAELPRRFELQRRGAEQFLIGGHIDRGMELIRTMLATMGVHAPRTPRAHCCRC